MSPLNDLAKKAEEHFEEIDYIKNENISKKKRKDKKDEKVDEEPYFKPIREPTKEEQRNMLAKSIEIMIIVTLENHIFMYQMRRLQWK